MEDVYYLPPGAGEGFYFTINPFDEERYMKVVDKAAESGDRMSSCRYGNISGEHVCDAIEEYTDLEHGGEPSAYLIGWIASCINKARLGIGDFIEIENDETN